MNKSIKINQIYNESTSPIYQNKKYNETFFQGYFNINISEDSYIETLEERTQSTMSISYKENTKQVTLTEQNGNNFSLHQGDSFIIDIKTTDNESKIITTKTLEASNNFTVSFNIKEIRSTSINIEITISIEKKSKCKSSWYSP